jgi:hypothetical protein
MKNKRSLCSLTARKLHFWKALEEPWIATFSTDVTEFKKKLDPILRKKFMRLAKDVDNSERLPPIFLQAFRRTLLRLEISFNLFLSRLYQCITDYLVEVRQVRVKDEGLLRLELMPGFDEAKTIKGL